MYDTGGQVWHHLRNYKDSPDPDTRSRLTLRVVALLARFLSQHGDCAAPDGWDWIVGVPSTRNPSLTHPLVAGLSRVPSMRDQVRELLGPGAVQLAHGRANDQGYSAPTTGSARVLLVDDTFTTGARLQSAASALALAGYSVTGAVVIGRVYDRSFGARGPALWDVITSRAFDFDRCCWCSEPWPPLI